MTNAIRVAKAREAEAQKDLLLQKHAVVEMPGGFVSVTRSFANSLCREKQSSHLHI